MSSPALQIHTIGYAPWSFDQVGTLVQELRGVLVDVRLRPYSSKPGFSKGDLQATLGERYKHVPALGNVRYRSGGIKLKNPERGVEEVAGFAAKYETIILMCGCANHRRCHRTQAAEYAAKHWTDDTRVSVEHLYPDGWAPEPLLFD